MSFITDLYRVVKNTPFQKEIQLCDATHQVFKAHFPNNPILPGFLQIEIAEALFDIEMKTIKKVKFLTLVKPLTHLIYTKTDSKIVVHDENNTKVNEIVYA